MRNLHRLASIGASLLLAGCCIQYRQQDITFEHHPEDDSAELVLVYRGVTATDDTEGKVGDALVVVQRLLAGKREFQTPFGSFDLDAPGLREGSADPDLLAVLDDVQLFEAAVFLDEEGQLAGRQRFWIDRCAPVLRLLNRRVSAAILEAASDGSLEKDTPLLDDRTRELWVRHASTGGSWIDLVDGEIGIDVPITRESWERVQREILSELIAPEAQSGAAFLAQVLGHLRHFEVADERLSIVFAPPATGIYQLSAHDPGVNYSPRLKEALEAAGVVVE